MSHRRARKVRITMATMTIVIFGAVILVTSSLPRPAAAYSSLAGSCAHAGVLHGETTIRCRSFSTHRSTLTTNSPPRRRAPRD